MTDNGKTVQADAGIATQPQTSQAPTSPAGEQAENVQAQTPQFVTPEQLEVLHVAAVDLAQRDREIKALLQERGFNV